MKKTKLKDWFINFFLAMGAGFIVPGLLLLGLPPDERVDNLEWGAWLLVVGFICLVVSLIMAVLEDLKGEGE
ncbi:MULTISPECIES: hypothetical protein [Pseudomonas]|uniref:Uncharacterized protein n=1 Tax=Pseudomonas nitroreducens TaxID=46680 RepID=A0A6G6J9H4_PSENT|nr:MULTISPECIES: hypothetical protein [Pseudomonas]QIE91131.1 hypothetical protein G5B91_32765 [Pseudomonas nitroreducens]UCL90272.1 hypothetical protein LDJ84_30325 [Pseudomonas sp. HS-18]